MSHETLGLVADCVALRRHFGWYVGETPSLPLNPTLLPFWLERVEEEVGELREAVEAGDVTEVADAVADILICVTQTALVCGVDPDAVHHVVYESVMRKVPDPNGGKAIKPEGWEHPDIGALLAAQPPLSVLYPDVEEDGVERSALQEDSK